MSVSSFVNPRKNARHAKPSKAAPLLVAGGMTVALSVAEGAALAAPASAHGTGGTGGTVEQFERLAQCESGGNWSINTGNGYYGGIQFSLATWRGIGYAGYPHQASKATQIQAGQKLQARSGWGQWPACSRKLGLSGGGGNSSADTAPVAVVVAAASTPAPRVAPRASRARGAAPAFDSPVLTVADRSRFSETAKAWQQRMRDRGWRITVDGYFGPQSSGVASKFAAEKGLSPAVRGTLDAAVFTAAWIAPVT